MPTIALIDDRKSDRDSLATNFRLALPKTWRCVPIAPLKNPADYAAWIAREEVQVIVLDWRLDEQTDVQHSVDYKGNVVVDAVRKRFPHMPVFVITAIPPDDLTDFLEDVEAIVSRKEFSQAPKKFVKPMIRAGERFAAQFQQDLAELSALSAKVAAGKATAAEIRKLRAVQMAMGLASDVDEEVCRAEALDKVEKKLTALESIGKEVREYIRKKAKK